MLNQIFYIQFSVQFHNSRRQIGSSVWFIKSNEITRHVGAMLGSNIVSASHGPRHCKIKFQSQMWWPLGYSGALS